MTLIQHLNDVTTSVRHSKVFASLNCFFSLVRAYAAGQDLRGAHQQRAPTKPFIFFLVQLTHLGLLLSV